ncbi:RNA 2'-phosphotransferase [Pseudomonas sp. AL 58]|uniref:RNA 2'-phosphotransferase n=1 Tax=Pseudomonas sp. AL 58 TaxID=3104275 RepID=UPI002EA39C58|nr:RNA 2'-phosphotransferase [Pseudomonas sp. AL 58]
MIIKFSSAREKGQVMTLTDDVSNVLNAWAPNLGVSFTTLAYLGSASSTKWLVNSPFSSQLRLLINADSHTTAAEMWHKVLREQKDLPAPVLLLILEHMRRNPVGMRASLKAANLGFSKTLANVAYRAAGALYEDAKYSFAGHEIDVAIARFRAALSEFRFSIESQLLSESTRRIATGKYATAVAMIGRWGNVSPETVSRALSYSEESMTLGNRKPETLTYRLELLVQLFDLTGKGQLLQDALELLTNNPKIAASSELAEVEVRYRLALLAEPGSINVKKHLEIATGKLQRSRPKGTVDEARCSVLSTLVAEAEQASLAMPARSTSIPRGLLALMAIKPSAELWGTIRCVIDGLEHLRNDRESVPSAVLSTQFLRQMTDGPDDLLTANDLSRYVGITGWLSEKASYNRHLQWEAGAAALSAAKRSGNLGLAHKALEVFNALTAIHPTWPLPLIGIARVREYLAGLSVEEDLSAIESWRDAATLALNSPIYARSNLGGRNEVFAVADARGFLSETFVFKRTTKEKAVHEASMLSALHLEITQQGDANLFEVPRSLAIVEVFSDDDRRWVHVSQRAAGRLVSELSTEEASNVLEPITDLLAVFHRVGGSAPEGKSAWRSLKQYLKMWSRTLFPPQQAERFVDSLHSIFPEKLPLVRKRDGHASNWLVDPAGRIVAIDLESTDFVPIGYDVSQLIEDNALIPASPDGWRSRIAIMERYLSRMETPLSKSELVAAYGWFAITRALRLGTERDAGKHLRRHARELCVLLTEFGDDATQSLARELLQALSRIEQANTEDSVPSHDHRRLSKAMAYQLRHDGPNNGVAIDKTGFASMDDLARALKVDSSHLLAVAEHPGEPRFEVRDDRIRALYGHTLNVVIEAGIKVGAPTALYHGSSWSVLDAIIKDGVNPMQRRMVHLTNIAGEAVAVGARKGAPIVLAIDQLHDAEPVAEGIWVAPCILPNRLSIVNPFIEEGGAVR